MPRILFAGTPDIAVPLLVALKENGYDIAGVLTASDKMQGRSSAPVAPPVKTAAQSLGLPVLQFDSLKADARKAVTELGADTLVTFAYGRIFGPMFLALFKNGAFNVHPSALPHLRGASPLVNTILECSRVCTVTLQDMGVKMDEGDIRAQESFPLSGSETLSDITHMAAECASLFVPKVLRQCIENPGCGVKQTGDPSYCTVIGKNDGIINFSDTALSVHAKIRAMNPWPKTPVLAGERVVYLTSVWGSYDDIMAQDVTTGVYECGTVIGFKKDRGLGIACIDRPVWIKSMQIPAKRDLDAASFINGNKWILDSKFTCCVSKER